MNNGTRSVYPCCDQEIFLFEPVSSKSGCKYREHQVSMETTNNNKLKPWLNSSQEVYNELITNEIMSLVCEDGDRSNQDQATQFSLEVMMKTELSRLNTSVSITSKDEKRDKRRPTSNRRQRTSHLKNRNKNGFPIHRKENGKHEGEEEEEEEDGSDLDEPGIVRIVIQHKDSPTRVNSSAAKTWNNELPTRLNQDLQRESDVKRMNDLINRLSVTKVPQPPSVHHTQQVGLRDKTSFDGGLYCQIEHKLKALLLQQQASLHSTASSSNFSTKTSKNK